MMPVRTSRGRSEFRFPAINAALRQSVQNVAGTLASENPFEGDILLISAYTHCIGYDYA
jgi:hypothetical protein